MEDQQGADADDLRRRARADVAGRDRAGARGPALDAPRPARGPAARRGRARRGPRAAAPPLALIPAASGGELLESPPVACGRVDGGSVLAGCGGVVLAGRAVPALVWRRCARRRPQRDAWETLELIDLALLAVALMALGWAAALADRGARPERGGGRRGGGRRAGRRGADRVPDRRSADAGGAGSLRGPDRLRPATGDLHRPGRQRRHRCAAVCWRCGASGLSPSVVRRAKQRAPPRRAGDVAAGSE